ncbi:hypothetical protein LCGC14_0467360 [marine sediment metagenome]|uniref:Uncharacterized protein n=1 Tax=marine sediment metagenome TaxID=412755 RepID=A0A0F9VM83_9ZZZZ
MIEVDGDEYYVVMDGVRLKGPFKCRDEAVSAEEECLYFMGVSDYKAGKCP